MVAALEVFGVLFASRIDKRDGLYGLVKKLLTHTKSRYIVMPRGTKCLSLRL